MKLLIIVLALGLPLAGCGQKTSQPQTSQTDSLKKQNAMTFKVEKTEADWKKDLTSQQYDVMRCGGTEPAFNNAYWNNHEEGTYLCASCGAELFDSETKYESGTGWPSFYKPKDTKTVVFHEDTSFGMHRTEALCANCGAHLGHVFDDGPEPTGQRYCTNSASLKFVPAEKK